METKDLVLLILLPIIIVSLALYTDKPAITGAVTAQQEKDNAIGTYSVSPSFRVKINYRLEDEYMELSQKLDAIIGSCMSENDMRQCLASKTIENKWSCEENKIAAVLNDFVDKFNDCLNLPDNGAVCRFSFDARELQDASFAIRLTPDSENQRIKAELTESSKILETSYINQPDLAYVGYSSKDSYGIPADSISISVKYASNKPEVAAAYAEFSDKPSNIKLSKLAFYKTNDGVKFIDEQEEKLFLLPTANKIIELPKVKIFKFCARTGTKSYAYDKTDSSVKLRDVVYRFAVTLPEPVTPPSIKSLTAEDKQKAEKSIALRWSKPKFDDGSDFPDIDHYNIYCSKNSFMDKDKQISLGSQKPTMAVKSNVNYDSWIVDISACGKEPVEENADYYFAVTAVSTANKEGKAIVQASAKSIDDLAPGAQKIVLINSDNVKEEKTSSACINLPAGKDVQIGNIWVGFFMPEKNEDGTTNVRTGERLTYYLHFSKQNPVSDSLNNCYRYKCVELDFAPKDKIDYEPKRIFTKNKEIDSPNTFFVESQTYCFTIAARDKNGNMIKALPYNFEKPQQWKEMELKPVAKGIFNDKGEISYS